MIDWDSQKSIFLLNPRLPQVEKERLVAFKKIGNIFRSHIWVTTSGSTMPLKWVALSKEALLSSAQAVNRFLSSSSADCWLNPLPDFHVGGIGIQARSYLSKAKLVDYKTYYEKWDPQGFVKVLMECKATLTSLVPTQVYDLVVGNLAAPFHLRGLIVGGGKLDETLYRKARQLGWKVLPSYGLTECSSQVATADPDTGKSDLILLDHVNLRINKAGLIEICSPSLLTAYGLYEERGWKCVDPKVEGWFTTEDKGVNHANRLEVVGRNGDFIKIGGESVHFQRLETVLEQVKLRVNFKGDAALFLKKDKRLGGFICLAVEGRQNEDSEKLVQCYQEQVAPFEKIRSIYYLPVIPRTALKKLQREKLNVLIEA